MTVLDGSFKEILSSEMVARLGGILAGALLVIYTDKLLLIPGMFVLLPGFLEMRGNISGSFASRLSSGLFLGVIKPNKANTKTVRGNVLASFFLAITVSLALGLTVFFFNYLLLKEFRPEIILLPLIAGTIANAVEIILTLFATFYIFRKGHDPNNIMGPFITTTGDITSILALLIALAIL
ncbi:magnesium transporter [Candidatus Woesearchaeota archaeon]|nr:magnesium transporter [Candidatus Woesearchaeota archaeon]